jgi:AraC-like DNA-binding protein
MIIKFGASQIFFLLSSILGVLVSSILLLHQKKITKRQNLFLGLSFPFPRYIHWFHQSIRFNKILTFFVQVGQCIGSMQKGEWEKITLEALAYQSGFNNRNSFTLSFKKFTGQTPSEYIRQLK